MSEEAVENGNAQEVTENGHTTAPEEAVGNGESRFSDDDVDTEIEVTPIEEGSDEKPKRKKKKSKDGEPRETSEERRERRRKRKEKKKREAENGEPDPPPYTSNEDINAKKRKKKKRNIKSQVNQLMEQPLFFFAGVLVCVILPFGIYACDVIISVNVIDRESYKNVVRAQENNMSQLPMPMKLIGQKYHIKETLLLTIQINAGQHRSGLSKSRISRQAPDDEPNIVETASDPPSPSPSVITDEAVDTTSTTTTTASSTTTTKSPASATSSTPGASTTTSTTPEANSNVTISINGTVKTTTIKQRNTTRKKPDKFRPRPGFRTLFSTLPPVTRLKEDSNITIDPSLWQQQDYEYCKGLYYFYELHLNYAEEYGSDWFNDQSHSVYQKEQTLFFMFTIIGFISLLIGLGLRCDMFLSDEWSSFVLVNLFLYSISMAVTASVFAQESGEGGLRCATCRFTTYCDDIDPWNYHTHWPAEPDTVQWSMVALLSFILKLIDCYAIAIMTLKFIVDVTADLWWVTCLKVFGWLFVFPMLIFTPMLGVIRYQALPATAPNDAVSRTVVEVFFYVGIAFWALGLVAMPLFCKMRMWSKTEEEEIREIEDEMYE